VGNGNNHIETLEKPLEENEEKDGSVLPEATE